MAFLPAPQGGGGRRPRDSAVAESRPPSPHVTRPEASGADPAENARPAAAGEGRAGGGSCEEARARGPAEEAAGDTGGPP